MSDHLKKSYRLSKIAAKTAHFGEKTQVYMVLSIWSDFERTLKSNLNTSLERPSQVLLNAYFNFEIGRSELKL